MHMSVHEIDQRIIMMLRKNSRVSVVDIARSLSISRTTAKKALDRIVADGRIRSFTIISGEEEENLALVHIRDTNNFPPGLILERFSLIDGTSLALIYLEDLADLNIDGIIDVKIVKRRERGDAPLRARNLHCDYCHSEIRGIPLTVEYENREYYVCCPNCQRDLNRILTSGK